MAGIKGQKSGKRTELPQRYYMGFLTHLDGRYKVAKVLKDRLVALMNDLGGQDSLSYQKQSLCQRAIFLEARIEGMESAMAENQAAPVGEYVSTVDCLNRLYKTLGLERHSKELRLADILRGNHGDK